jgi:hypothetical protein
MPQCCDLCQVWGETHIRNSARGVGQDPLELAQRVVGLVGGLDASLGEPVVSRVLDLSLDGRLEEIDNTRFGRVDVLGPIAVWAAVGADVVGRETGLG